MSDAFVFPERWHDVRGHDAGNARERQRLVRELLRELPEAHPLFGLQVEAVARCYHCDDAVFALDDGRYVVVHLAYTTQAPDRPPWPATQPMDHFDKVARYAEHHAEYA